MRKVTDESVTSSTTLQSDDELTFSIGASETWLFQIVAQVHSASDTPDFKVAVSGPTGATGAYGIWGIGSSSSGTSAVSTLSFYTFDGSTSGGFGAISAADIPTLVDGVIVNSTTAGSVALSWAQNTSNGTATTVKAGSTLFACRIA